MGRKKVKIFSKTLDTLAFSQFLAKYTKGSYLKSLFNHSHQNQLFTKCQSGFLPGDSCILKFLSIVQEINFFFNYNPSIDVSGVFLDISKVFDKV